MLYKSRSLSRILLETPEVPFFINIHRTVYFCHRVRKIRDIKFQRFLKGTRELGRKDCRRLYGTPPSRGGKARIKRL